MNTSGFTHLLAVFRRTPLHPQWLLGTHSAVLPQLTAIKAGTLLDIGCADRWVEKRLHKGVRYLGLDYLATGKDLYGARPDIFGDARRIPLAEDSVDAVVMLEVLEHLKHPREALLEIARVLRPGGQLLLTVPFLYPIHDAPHDFQRYTIHGLTREMETAGLQLEHAKPTLGSAETAGLLGCIALAAMALQALQQKKPAVLLLPLVAIAIPVINLLAWLVGKLMPDWPALTAGYRVQARKPADASPASKPAP